MTTKNLFDETARNLVTQHAFSPYETCVSAIVEALENSRDDVIEECAKVVEADDSFMMLQDFGLQTAMTQKSQNIALAIRALKATPSEAGLKSEAQRSDEVDPAGDAASLTHNPEDLTRLITNLKSGVSYDPTHIASVIESLHAAYVEASGRKEQ